MIRRVPAVSLAGVLLLALPSAVPDAGAASDVGESTERVSVASDGTEGDDDSSDPSIRLDPVAG